MERLTLFDSIISEDNIHSAWTLVQHKNPVGGIDNVAVNDYSRNLAKRLSHLRMVLK